MKDSQSLIVRPKKGTDVPLKFAKRCAIEIKNTLQQNGKAVIDLKGTKAFRNNVINSLAGMKNGDSFLAFGHGNPDYIKVDSGSPIFTIQDTHHTFGKICYFLSCCTAKGIGEKSIKDGAKAFIGFRDDFKVPDHYQPDMIEACLSGITKFLLGRCVLTEIQEIMDKIFEEKEVKLKNGNLLSAMAFAYNRNSLSVLLR